MKANIVHEIDLPADEFFEKIFFNEEFNADMFDELQFESREVKVNEDRGDTIYREVYQVPERDLPGPVKKVLGVDKLAYTEKTTYFKGQNRADIEVVSSVKPDKVKVKGAFRVEPLGADRCKRIFDLEVKVGIFGIGGVIEKAVMDDVKKSYGRSAEITNRYLANQ